MVETISLMTTQKSKQPQPISLLGNWGNIQRHWARQNFSFASVELIPGGWRVSVRCGCVGPFWLATSKRGKEAILRDGGGCSTDAYCSATWRKDKRGDKSRAGGLTLSIVLASECGPSCSQSKTVSHRAVDESRKPFLLFPLSF